MSQGFRSVRTKQTSLNCFWDDVTIACKQIHFCISTTKDDHNSCKIRKKSVITFPSGHLAVHCQKGSRPLFLTNKGQRQSQLNLLGRVFPRIMSSRCICSNQLKATKVQESMIVAILRLQRAAQGINVKMAV